MQLPLYARFFSVLRVTRRKTKTQGHSRSSDISLLLPHSWLRCKEHIFSPLFLYFFQVLENLSCLVLHYNATT